MATTIMGFEGMFYGGSAGSTASTLDGNVRDVNYEFDTEKGDTTVRGTAGTPPVQTQRVVQLMSKITFNKLNKTSDALLTAMLTAAATGVPYALRLKSSSSGKGYDGDVILTFKEGQPFKGEETYDFEAVPNDDNRTPQVYV